MKNSEYWKDRMVELELKALEKGEKYYKNLQEQYDIAIHNINKDITIWYERLAKNNEISLAEAKKLLDKNELKEFQWTLQDYIKYGEENAVSQNWMKELENASAKHHINKLQSLQIQMKQHLEKLASKQQHGMKSTLSDIYSDTYYHTAFEVQKGFHTGWSFDKLDTNRIEKVLNQGWLDGKNFSDRIWANQEKLVNTLNTELTQMIIRGESPDRAIQAISAKMGVSKKQAGKLVMTESSMIASVSQKDCFLNLGVKQFEIVGTLDRDTCETCGSLDGTHLSMTDYAVGQTAPPFHANCRCCTAPYFPDDEGHRIARDEEGKSHYIDSHIKYDDWKKKFVEKSDKKVYNDLELPTYIRMNIAQNYNPENEVDAINTAVMEMPVNIQKAISKSSVEIFTKGQLYVNGKEVKNSFYDRKNDIIHIYQGADKYEVIHEIGHLIETKYDVLNDQKYIKIRAEGLENYNASFVKSLSNYKNTMGIKNSKFISELQGKIYKVDLNGKQNFTSNRGLNLNCLGEYFSEGFREYFENRSNLKIKDVKLFEYIKERIENDN